MYNTKVELPNKTRQWFKVSSVTTLIQMLGVLFPIFVFSMLGSEPTSAKEFYDLLQTNRIEAILRIDFSSLIVISFLIFPAVCFFILLRDKYPFSATISLGSVLIAVAIGISIHYGLSLIHLGDLYAQTSAESTRQQLLASGNSLIASGWYHSTGYAVSGIFCQGAFVLFLFLLLKEESFSNKVAILGILANGLDLLHVIVAFINYNVGFAILAIGGIFYLLWFPFLAYEFYKISRSPR